MAFNPKQHMTDLRGRDYLEVKWRIVWFREEHPTGRIAPEIISTDPLIVRATISNGDGIVLATGHGSADAGGRKVVWTGREVEKAETAAIGRALAHAGYGTQFTGEDEGEHIADSPVEKPASKKPAKADTKTPHAKKPAVVKWLVSEGIAQNGHGAANLYDLMNGDAGAVDALLDDDRGDDVRDLFKLYRAWQTEGGMKPEFAAVYALEGKTPEGEPE